MFFKEDTTFQRLREDSMMQWLNDLAKSDDFVNQSGANLTIEYIEYLKEKIKELERKSALKDEFLKKLKAKTARMYRTLRGFCILVYSYLLIYDIIPLEKRKFVEMMEETLWRENQHGKNTTQIP